MFDNLDLNQLVVMIVPLLFAVTLHEVAHGWVAYRMGDNTAKLAGRLTLNPIKHLDITGSFILPLMLKLMGSPVIFGYAKPVPVNFNNLRNYRKGILYVSSAGIAVNLALVVISGAFFQGLLHTGPVWYDTIISPVIMDLVWMLGFSVWINSVLAVFNLIPIPPLDGSRILAMLLPTSIRKQFVRFERLGFIIIIVWLVINRESLFKIILFVMAPLIKFSLGSYGIAFFSNIGDF
jgi:Zn-dependent protease